MRRQPPPLLDGFLRGLDERHAAGQQGARAAAAPSLVEGVAIPLGHPDALEGDTQALGHELGEGGLVALARGLGAGTDRDRVVDLDPERGQVVGHAGGGVNLTAQRDAA